MVGNEVIGLFLFLSFILLSFFLVFHGWVDSWLSLRERTNFYSTAYDVRIWRIWAWSMSASFPFFDG